MTKIYKTLNGHVIVYVETKTGETTESGLILLSNNQDTFLVGTVVGIADTLSTGDTLVFNRHTAKEFPLMGKGYFIMKEEMILAKEGDK